MGCNVVMGQFLLWFLIVVGVIDLDQIILDLKCVVFGVGWFLKENLLYVEFFEGYNVYVIGGMYWYFGEFDQEFSVIVGWLVKIQFMLYFLLVNRGILVMGYVQGDV